MRISPRFILAAMISAFGVLSANNLAFGQSTLPEIAVTEPKQAPKKKPAPAPASEQPSPSGEAAATAAKIEKFDTARANLSPKVGANSYDINHETIQALPQGSDTPMEKVLLQAPGVTQDSAASGNLHVRNEHANVAYRINGIMLPDGISGFGQVLDTSFVGNLSLITGALPAQFGLRTAGVVDITSRRGFENGGSVGVYGGSHGTVTPSFEYSGTSGNTEYFFTGRYLQNSLGLENPTLNPNAIHDRTRQESGFGYVSTLIDDATRVSLIFGTSTKNYQIPNNPGQPPAFTAFGIAAFDSALLNENQMEQNHFAVLALQKSLGDVDLQLSYFTQYSSLHFKPDLVGDLMFNGVATDVFRSGFTNGIQADASYRLSYAHTLRAGFSVSAEQSQVTNSSQLLPVDAATQMQTVALGDTPFGVVDSSSKLGWLIGTYVQDEWRITDRLTLNTGLRFDQMYQYMDANQVSPRVGLTYKPFDGTTFHAGYARNFTPPSQVIAAPTNTALFAGCPPPAAGCTTVQQNLGVPPPYGKVLPERSHVFDVGVVQKVLPGLDVGIDAYYKIARDLLDDGQFGAAYVLNGFNYDKGNNLGVELKTAYTNGNFRAYGNIAWARQLATDIVSNQYLFAADRLAYIATHYIYTDHTQIWTGSAGASYLWNGTRFSMDMIYGSGLRSGFANIYHVPDYTQYNVGVSHEFEMPDGKNVTARFDVVNVFDKVYEIRDGTGIGVFAPQFGPRRGYFVGLSKRI